MVKNLLTNHIPKHKNIKNTKITVKQILSILDIKNPLLKLKPAKMAGGGNPLLIITILN